MDKNPVGTFHKLSGSVSLFLNTSRGWTAWKRSHLTWHGVFSQFTARGGQISALKQYLRDTRRETRCHLRRKQGKTERENVLYSQYARKRPRVNAHRSEMSTGRRKRGPWYLDCPRGRVNTGDTQRSVNRWLGLRYFFSRKEPWKGTYPLASWISASNFTDNEVAQPNVDVFLSSGGKSEVRRKHESSTTRTSIRVARSSGYKVLQILQHGFSARAE